jgi:1-acyl-sn-glycerol-3-phosphate acyltransferase
MDDLFCLDGCDLCIDLCSFAFFPLQKNTHNWIAGPGFSFVLKLILCPTQVTYDPTFDPNRRSVFGQNHVNLLDAFIASKAIPHVFCGLMHKWQFKIPIYGWMMAVSKGIPCGSQKSKRHFDQHDRRSQKEKRGWLFHSYLSRRWKNPGWFGKKIQTGRFF